MKRFPKLADFSQTDLVKMADAHQVAAFRFAFRDEPHAKGDDRYFEILTGLPDPFANMAMGLDVTPAEERVSNATDRVKTLAVPALWWVGPTTRPKGLGDILNRNGWEGPHPVPAMVIDLDQFAAPAAPQGFQLQEVRTIDELAEWNRVSAEGFSMPLEAAQLIRPQLGGLFRAYIGYLDGQPVGTTGTFPNDGVVGIYCVSTVPSHRGRGVGAALTALPLLIAKDEGFRTGTLQASRMGHPVYEKLGFRDVCNLSLYSYKPAAD